MAKKFGSSVSQIAQIGVESTPGSAAAITRRLQSIGITLNPNSEIQDFKPRGAKLKTGHIQNREWSTGSLEGGLAFNELQYVLSSVMSQATVTQKVDPADNTTPVDAWDWEFVINQYEADNPATYTIESGDLKQQRGRRGAYGLVNEFSLQAESTGQVQVSGGLVAQILEDPVSDLTTTGITVARPVWASPKMISIYLDDTPEALGTTRNKSAFRFEHSISDRYGQVWTLDDQESSFVEHNEGEPSITTQFTFADTQELDPIIAAVREGQRKYIRIKFTGPEIVPDINYALIIDMACGISEDRQYDDQDGTWGAQFTAEAEYDDTLGFGIKVTLTTDSDAL